MTQADRVHSTPPTNTPVDPTRRRFLSQAAGVAAGSTVLTLAISPASTALAPASPLDAVYGLIEAHRMAATAWHAYLKAHGHLEEIDDEDVCHAAMDAFHELVETAPKTFAGLVAWAAYLDEIRQQQAWIFEEEGATLVVTLVEALGNLSVSS
jgi:hypothetical protein